MKNTFKQFLVNKFMLTPNKVSAAYSNESEMLEHFMSGEVDIPIKTVVEYVDEYLEENSRVLPSRHQIGNFVEIDLADFKVNKAEILAIHFTESKVKYDLVIHAIIEGEHDETRIYNVDSAWITDYSEVN